MKPLMAYGWLNVVYEISGKDFLKYKQVFELPAVEFMNYVQYLSDYKQQLGKQ